MKKSIFALFLLVTMLSFGSLYAQVNPVSGVIVKPNADQDKVTITYNLQPNARMRCYIVTLKINMDGQVITASGLSGDIGQCVFPGMGKKVIWDALTDVTELTGELKVDVTAVGVPIPCTKLNAVPVYAGLGGVAASGFGLLIAGLTQEGNSKDLYTVYKANLDPSASVFSDLSRDDHYSEANSKHKTGQVLTYGGIGVIAVGGYILVTRLMQVKAYNRKCAGNGTTYNEPKRLRFEPKVNSVGLANTSSSYGLSLSYRF
jgi:hypothetical protein